MRDPYLYENTEVLKNKLDIRTQDGLNDAEADGVSFKRVSNESIAGRI
jgi:fido (protein-threonine AMPylation protein)